jgi:hypothetical protein
VIRSGVVPTLLPAPHTHRRVANPRLVPCWSSFIRRRAVRLVDETAVLKKGRKSAVMQQRATTSSRTPGEFVPLSASQGMSTATQVARMCPADDKRSHYRRRRRLNDHRLRGLAVGLG